MVQESILTSDESETVNRIPLRAAETVMRLERLGSFHRSRLSFMQTLLRRLEREQWRFSRALFDIDQHGVGRAVYTVFGSKRAYSLVCFAHDLPDEMRSDRVIATAWDATFTLFDGVPSRADIERLAENVPKQEAGRISDRELSLSRANRSVRLFNAVVQSLAEGRQPDMRDIDNVGYLMRTTAVYGSGKFGAADREQIKDRPELKGPFQAEMLTVWLIRTFVIDLVEHLARCRGGDVATTLNPTIKRRLGIGNSTGLGMAPFIANHPVLLNNWIMARETALARVRSVPSADQTVVKAFRALLADASENAAHWQSSHPVQIAKLKDLRCDLVALSAKADDPQFLQCDHPFDQLWQWAGAHLSIEGQEALASLLIDCQGTLTDDLADQMNADEDAAFRIDGGMTTQRLRSILDEIYGEALTRDYDDRSNIARFWYVSEEKLEPRLGQRFDEEGAERELPLSVSRDAAAMAKALDSWQGDGNVAAFLLAHAEHRHTARRAQIAARYPYSEIRDNLIADDLLPIDLLRCKLSFFGADRFDPRSDRWVRICMYRDAPFPDELLRPA